MTLATIGGACMKSGISKVYKKAKWDHPPFRACEYDVDGTTKGKPSPTGIGNALNNNKGEF